MHVYIRHFFFLLQGDRRTEAAPAGVRRLHFTSCGAHLFKLLSSPSFSEASQVEHGHEVETEKKLVGLIRMKGTEEEGILKATLSSFLQTYPGCFCPAAFLSGKFKALLPFLF